MVRKEIKPYIGIIEDGVGEARHVDPGIGKLERMATNAPLSESSRREFLSHGAGVAAWLITAGFLGKGCAPMTYQGTQDGTSNSDVQQVQALDRRWEDYLMHQDLIRGPPLIRHPKGGELSDFMSHLRYHENQGIGAVDYNVPVGTPITPVRYGRVFLTKNSFTGGNLLALWHFSQNGDPSYNSLYMHLSRFVKDDKNPNHRKDFFDINKVIAFSGDTGYGPGGFQPSHLHLQIAKLEPDGYVERMIDGVRKKVKYWQEIKPGLDPFKNGIDGGKPVYWDAKAVTVAPWERPNMLNSIMYTLDERLRKQDEVDKETLTELLKRQKDPVALRDYLGMRVLQKKQGPNGLQYEFMPGSFMYGLMLDVLANMKKEEEMLVMLPFIYPSLIDKYQAKNPNIQFAKISHN